MLVFKVLGWLALAAPAVFGFRANAADADLQAYRAPGAGYSTLLDARGADQTESAPCVGAETVMQKPDFSGEWTLNVAACALSPVVAPVVQRGFVRIAHREPTVSVHLSITMNGEPVEVRFERLSNWDGDALAFTDTVPTPTGDLTISFRYELQDSGSRLRAAEQLRGAGREQDNVWVFDRAAPT